MRQSFLGEPDRPHSNATVSKISTELRVNKEILQAKIYAFHFISFMYIKCASNVV